MAKRAAVAPARSARREIRRRTTPTEIGRRTTPTEIRRRTTPTASISVEEHLSYNQRRATIPSRLTESGAQADGAPMESDGHHTTAKLASPPDICTRDRAPAASYRACLRIAPSARRALESVTTRRGRCALAFSALAERSGLGCSLRSGPRESRPNRAALRALHHSALST